MSALDSAQSWQDTLIDHSQFPRRHGELEDATHQASGENPLCGDRVHLQLQVDSRGVISDARFAGVGCAVSLASASMLAEHVVGLDVTRAGWLFAAVRGMLTEPGEPAPGVPQDLLALQLVRRYPARVKCATLAWHALRYALEDIRQVATTE